MKLINISTKKYPERFAMVDDCDYKEVSKHKWHPRKSKGGRVSVHRTFTFGSGTKTISMHTAIMGKVPGMQIDHRDGDTFDNQRHNMRHCTHAENQRNKKVSTRNSSGYKGVSWAKNSKKWLACIRYNNKGRHLGYFTCLIKAARAYDKAAIKYHGEFACLNFPITVQ